MLSSFIDKLEEHEKEMPESMCSKCEETRYDNVKLLRDVKSLTLENKKFIKTENDLKKSNKNFRK